MKSVCVFCGSSMGANPLYAETAKQFGELVARLKLTLIYGGASVGLMGIVANSALMAGGQVQGVIPDPLFGKEVAHQGLTKLHVVGSMHERKQLMYTLADAFVAMPGGLGTLDELCEILTWAQLGLHKKPCGLLNVDGYFDPLLNLFETAVSKGFMRAEHCRLLAVDKSPELLMVKLGDFESPHLERWITHDEV